MLMIEFYCTLRNAIKVGFPNGGIRASAVN